MRRRANTSKEYSAYNSIEWDFLNSMMEKFNSSPEVEAMDYGMCYDSYCNCTY